MGLDYDSTIMLTCKLLLAIAKAIVDIGPAMSAGLFFFRTRRGGGGRRHRPPMPPLYPPLLSAELHNPSPLHLDLASFSGSPSSLFDHLQGEAPSLPQHQDKSIMARHLFLNSCNTLQCIINSLIK